MTQDHSKAFEKRYRASLQLHLEGDASTQASTKTAFIIGQVAAESGMDAVDLVRTHDQAMSDIASQRSGKKQRSAETLTLGGAFLLESMSTLTQRKAKLAKDVAMTLSETKQSLTEEIERYAQLLTDSRRKEEEARQLAHKILYSQEEERKELSRELHDKVAQILAAINVRLAALRESEVINLKTFELNIQETQKMIEESVDLVHHYAKKLRPAVLDDLGLIPALRSLTQDVPLPPGLELHLEATPEAEALDKTQCTIVYRVIQAALLNVIRHAEAHRATIRLLTVPEGIRLEVEDDGKSFSVDNGKGSNSANRLGLIGMKERVEIVGGRFFIESKAGKGTTVRADIPFKIFTPEDPK